MLCHFLLKYGGATYLEKKMKYISKEIENELLNKEDLSENSNHCIGLLVKDIREYLEKYYGLNAILSKGEKVVSIVDNYTALGYMESEVTLSERYTKYISETLILRTQMSSAIPPLLRTYDHSGDKLYLCPGIVYRRDVRDKTHVGEPHQMDVWLLTKSQKTREDLLILVKNIISVIEKYLKQEIEWRYNETSHNYTDDGIEVEINYKGKWLEVLECGLISKNLLKNHNLDEYSGLALGMGLERLVMIIKGIEDIRVLYDSRKEVKSQMSNLNKYKVVSKQPSTKRDLSIAINKNLNEEEITEIILSKLDINLSSVIEEIKILAETNYDDLPNIAKERLGINMKQKNVLLRIVLRDLVTSISSVDANAIYSKIYEEIHEGETGYKITNKGK